MNGYEMLIKKCIHDHIEVFNDVGKYANEIEVISELVHSVLMNKKKIMFCGNGGSAADCQHLAAEMIGRFKVERHPFNSISLTTDTSVLTAIANDYSFSEVFSRQVAGLGEKDDLLFLLSTSGMSENVISAAEAAKKMNIHTVSLTGNDGGRLAKLTDVNITIGSRDTARIQEAHIFIGHVICEIVESKYDQS